jgi:transposase
MPGRSEALLLEINAQLRQQLEAQAKLAQSAEQELEYARLKIRVLEERLRLERIAKYGKHSETLSDLQLELLDLEPGVSGEEVAAESEREPVAPPPEDKQDETPADKTQDKPRRKHPGRQALPAHLERLEQIVACTAEQCACAQCGHETQVIGYEQTEVLDVRPAEYFVTVIKREKRACRQCEEQGVRTAAAAERIAAKSLLSDRVIIDLVVAVNESEFNAQETIGSHANSAERFTPNNCSTTKWQIDGHP